MTEWVGGSMLFNPEQPCLSWDTKMSPYSLFLLDMVEQDLPTMPASQHLDLGKAAPSGSFPRSLLGHHGRPALDETQKYRQDPTGLRVLSSISVAVEFGTGAGELRGFAFLSVI